MSGLTKRPGLKSPEDFINAAPDGVQTAAVVSAPVDAAAAVRKAEDLEPVGLRKKPISLTIDGKLLRQLDAKAAALGISRAAAFALAVSRFIAAEEREANR